MLEENSLEALMQKMKQLTESSQEEEPTQEELLKRFQLVEHQSLESKFLGAWKMCVYMYIMQTCVYAFLEDSPVHTSPSQSVFYFMSVPCPQQRGLFQCWLSVFPYQMITCCVGQKWDIFHASNILSTHSDCLCLPDRWSIYWSEWDIVHSSQVLSTSCSHTSCPLCSSKWNILHTSNNKLPFCSHANSWLAGHSGIFSLQVLTALWDYMCSCASCPLVDQSGIFCIPVTVNFLAAFLSPC